MATTGAADALLGRRGESAALERLIDEARSGRSTLLVLRGDPGVGKTALLDQAVEMATDLQVARVAGVESEMELAFAALQQLCGPLLEHLEHLPGPQSEALSVAFGLSSGDSPDFFLVALAALTLLSEAAVERPLLCIVDDAQWLDQSSAQVLGFIGRRLLAEPIGFIVATREQLEDFRGLPERLVGGLSDAAARELLNSAIRGQLDTQVADRIIAETRGNPLALLELPRGLTPAQLAGGFGTVGTPSLSDRIEDSFRGRYEALPPDTRRLLLLAAAEPVGDPLLLWRAAERLGVGPDSEGPAESAGLLAIGTRVVFRHPLVRSSIYRTALPEERRLAHRVLAEVTDPASDPDRRAWHRAHATAGPDENVASELEASAGRAQSRGGVAAAAIFIERASQLTLDPERRAQRCLAAAQAKQQIGAFDAALALLAAAESGPLDAMHAALADQLHGRIAFALNFGSDASPLLLRAAKRLEQLDGPLSQVAYLEAIFAALIAGRLVNGASLQEIVEQAAGALLFCERAPHELLLKGLAMLVTNGSEASEPTLRAAVAAFRENERSEHDDVRWLWLAGHVAGLMWDYDGWDALSARLVEVGRGGALTLLPMGLSTRAGALLFAGEFEAAAFMCDEESAISEITGSRIAPYGSLSLAAFRGQESDALALIDATIRDARDRGEGAALTFAQWTAAVLCNGLGRYEEAAAWAEQAGSDSSLQRFRNWALLELIEAATRTGDTDAAVTALDKLNACMLSSGTDWAIGTQSCARALLGKGEVAEIYYRAAIERLDRTRLRVAYARAQLLYGEWLRRERRRFDAREHLRIAHKLFSEFGMEAFAKRARIELEATGERARKRNVTTLRDLTPQEAQISRLASEGLTNAEIAAQMYLSASTVDYHLRKAFRKLGIKSRAQLGRHMPS